MITTQRFLIIVVCINLLSGVFLTMYDNPTLYDENVLDSDIDYYEGANKEFKDGDLYSSAKNTDIEVERSIGNQLTWGDIIVGILWNGLNPFAITPSQYNNPFEKMIAIILIIFRTLMGILIGIEAYMFYKNNKTT